MIHTHISSVSRDCDGQYDREQIVDRRIDPLMMPSTTHGEYTLDFTEGKDDELLWHLNASTPTEEGYEAVELIECDDDCDFEKSSFRDHTAERAGY